MLVFHRSGKFRPVCFLVILFRPLVQVVKGNFNFAVADPDTAEQDAEQTTEAACKEAATAAGADTTAAATVKLGQQGAFISR